MTREWKEGGKRAFSAGAAPIMSEMCPGVSRAAEVYHNAPSGSPPLCAFARARVCVYGARVPPISAAQGARRSRARVCATSGEAQAEGVRPVGHQDESSDSA